MLLQVRRAILNGCFYGCYESSPVAMMALAIIVAMVVMPSAVTFRGIIVLDSGGGTDEIIMETMMWEEY